MKGAAHGAISILNATATGIGCSLATRDTVTATWDWGMDRLEFDGTDDRLAVAAYWHLAWAFGRHDGAHIQTTTELPPACGLKTSSAAAAAMLQAGATAAGKPLDTDALIAAGVTINRKAGTTLTGAYDDQVAVVKGGCHITNNAAGTVLKTLPPEPWHIAIWVPEEGIPKSRFLSVNLRSIQADIKRATMLAMSGDIAGAMTANGAAYTRAYQAAGIPVNPAPAAVALEAGAAGAGLSGTGPAVAALFRDGADLAPVPGGAWHWTEAA